MKIMTVVGTRPEIIKLSRVISLLDRHAEHILVHTGQNFDFELNGIFFKDFDIREPDYFLNAAKKNAVETIGQIITKIDSILAKESPEAFLILGDTNSCLAAYAAKRRKIPIFHMEAGNRCFDQRVPEEINRKIIDHISDINMPYTEHARRYLIKEGIRPETIIKTGSPMKEVLSHNENRINSSNILECLRLKCYEYFVVSAHREENIDNPANFDSLLKSISLIARTFRKPVIVSTHPRTRKKLEKLGIEADEENIKFMKPLGFHDYVKLQKNAGCVVSDSGTITEESSIMHFPAVTIRQTHERPEGMDEGTLIMCGLDENKVLQAINITMDRYSTNRKTMKTVNDYDTVDVSQKVLNTILSYTDYIKRTVWFELKP